jgi:hypothetical protein
MRRYPAFSNTGSIRWSYPDQCSELPLWPVNGPNTKPGCYETDPGPVPGLPDHYHLSAQKKKARPKDNTYTRSFGMTLSLPWANMYSYYDHQTGRPTAKAGFVGLGLSYYYKNKKSKYSLNLGFTGDLPVPMGPVMYGKTGTRSSVAAFFAEGNYHHPIYKRLGYVAGVNFLSYGYRFMDHDTTRRIANTIPPWGLQQGWSMFPKRAFRWRCFTGLPWYRSAPNNIGTSYRLTFVLISRCGRGRGKKKSRRGGISYFRSEQFSFSLLPSCRIPFSCLPPFSLNAHGAPGGP